MDQFFWFNRNPEDAAPEGVTQSCCHPRGPTCATRPRGPGGTPPPPPPRTETIPIIGLSSGKRPGQARGPTQGRRTRPSVGTGRGDTHEHGAGRGQGHTESLPPGRTSQVSDRGRLVSGLGRGCGCRKGPRLVRNGHEARPRTASGDGVSSHPQGPQRHGSQPRQRGTETSLPEGLSWLPWSSALGSDLARPSIRTDSRAAGWGWHSCPRVVLERQEVDAQGCEGSEWQARDQTRAFGLLVRCSVYPDAGRWAGCPGGPVRRTPGSTALHIAGRPGTGSPVSLRPPPPGDS